MSFTTTAVIWRQPGPRPAISSVFFRGSIPAHDRDCRWTFRIRCSCTAIVSTCFRPADTTPPRMVPRCAIWRCLRCRKYARQPYSCVARPTRCTLFSIRFPKRCRRGVRSNDSPAIRAPGVNELPPCCRTRRASRRHNRCVCRIHLPRLTPPRCEVTRTPPRGRSSCDASVMDRNARCYCCTRHPVAVRR